MSVVPSHFKPLSVRDDLATGATAPQASVGVRVLLSFWTVPSEPGETRDVSRETLSGAVSEEPPHRACSLDSDMDQRMDALRRANEVRTLRAQLKRDLKAGRVSIGALLLDPPPFLETAKVFDMLLALPRHGRVKATKILHSCRVSPSTTFGGLSERQRTELAGHFDR